MGGARLEQLLKSHREQSRYELTEKFEELARKLNFQLAQPVTNQVQEEATTNNTASRTKYDTFLYNDKHWHVPENFEFPRLLNAASALRLWLKGTRSGNKAVRPYRELQTKGDQYKIQWDQFFNKFLTTY